MYLGLILLAMALTQASDPRGFHAIVADYVLGPFATGVLAIALPAAAAVAGIGLLARGRSPVPAVVALAVAVTWSVLAVQAFARGLALGNCGCFGVHLAQPLRWWILLEDVWFVGLAIWVWRDARRDVTRPAQPVELPAR